MADIYRRKKMLWLRLLLAGLHLLVTTNATTAFAASFKGGSGDGHHELTIYSQVYRGGNGSGFSSSSSSDASLGFSVPAKLNFSISPSTSKVAQVFTRQPIVQVLDANNNVVTSDNSTQVTVSIL
ncbi:MAG: hypothetical protein KC649_05725, partial [Candidatus Omnitrophica bacterium]|nr:hypothetical protein [Candidatus Omnitrophota bacterium]